jgi:competence protein ComFC
MRFFNFILNILFPTRGASCSKEGDFLCNDCVERLKIKDLRLKSVCPSKLDFKYLDGVIYGLGYAENPGIQAAVQQFKYKYTIDLVEYFGDLIADKIRQLNMTRNHQIVLIPVPLHKKRLNQRGFNQAELIARAVKERVGDSVVISNSLERVKHTRQQARLNKKERHENLEDAFILNTKFTHSSASVGMTPIYFIVDDICTTGATLENCAKVLKDAGIEKIYGLVIARAFK